ncbi:MAG: sigma-70 family RNA polymerase sigma factor [Geodermatophilaceae bacterium]|nr:sigma-70 family RNA polymerase sigma factor [Geodermatophilaceae bacterium]
MLGTRTNTDLVEAAARGDQEGWDEIVQRYLPLVFSVIRRYRLSPKDAEDVSQTVWLRLVEHLDTIREPRALPMWIATTTRNEALRLVSAHRRTTPVDPLGTSTLDAVADTRDVDEQLLGAERQQAMRDGLAELPPRQRELLLLLVADPPLSYETIGARLGMPVGSIGPTRARCLARLRNTPAMQAFLANGHDTDRRWTA